MNQLIYNQLMEISKDLNLQFNNETTQIYIPKKCLNELELGKAYVLELADYILHPSDGFNLHINWNNGCVPTDRYLYALVKKELGKMIFIESYGYNIESSCIKMSRWNGWLPKKSIKIIRGAKWIV